MRCLTIIWTVLLTTGLYSCSTPDEKAEQIVLDCLNENNSIALDILPSFEKFLIDSGYIHKWDKDNLKTLLKDVHSGRIEISQSDFIPEDKYWEMETTFISQFALWTSCFRELTAQPADNNSSITRLTNAIDKIVIENNVGSPNDQAMIDAISDKDFDKTIYRVSVFYLTWFHIRYAGDDADK